MNTAGSRRFLQRLKCSWIRHSYGARVHTRGEGNRVDLAEASLYGTRIEITGRNNQLIIGANTRMWAGAIKIRGDNLRCTIGDYCRLREVELVLEDEGSRLIVGAGTTGTRCTVLAGEGGRVEIGADCMMSVGADIRNTDGHSVFEESTGRRINPAADIVLEDHVWIGLKAQVLKGVCVHTHSIVAAGCVVIRDVPPHTIVAGVPARTVRAGITWKRERLAEEFAPQGMLEEAAK